MAAARYWRLVGIETLGGGDLELSAIALYAGSTRVDGSATLTCSHAPTTGVLANLQDLDTATTAAFSATAVRTGGFHLQWDLGAAEAVSSMRFGSSLRGGFLQSGTLLYSSDAIGWTVLGGFGGLIYPGDFSLTALGGALFGEAPSEWDVASKGGGTTVVGRVASVWSNFAGKVRTDTARTSGRRVFGMRLKVVNPPQTFFGGLSALSSWGSYNTGRHWLLYGSASGEAYAYSFNSYTLMTALNGNAPLAVNDVSYFDVDLDAGTLAAKLNGGSWTTPIAMPYFTPGDDYVLSLLAPSTSGAIASAELLTTASELVGNIPSGAGPWDSSEADMVGAATIHTSMHPLAVAASAAVHGFSTRNAGRIATARDIEFGGCATLYGTTKTKGTPNSPAKARVVLLHQRSKQLVRETWSDPTTGNWVFTGIDEKQTYIALAEDAAGNFRPVAVNKLIPEVLA